MKQKINSWADITVGQFIDLHSLSKQKDSDELDQAEQAVAIMYGLTGREVEELPMQTFNKLAAHCTKIMTSKIEGSVKKVIQGGKNKYRVIYNPRKLVHRQFVEVHHFSNEMMDNIHNIMASIVMPIGKFGIAKKNTAEAHTEIANDLLESSIVDVYHSCVFFCKLYLNSLVHIQGYLVHEMMKKGATKEQAVTLINNSIDAMAGSITQKNWLLLKV
jgi:hypothetical protein